MMTPAERFAALRTLEAAVKTVAADAAEDAIQHASDTGADRWRTEYGTVVIATRKDAPVIADEQGYLEWVRANHPTEIVETVRPGFTKMVLEHAQVVGDHVVDEGTGEVLPFAMIRRGTVYASTPKADAKENAVARWEGLLRSRLDAIAGDRPALP